MVSPALERVSQKRSRKTRAHGAVAITIKSRSFIKAYKNENFCATEAESPGNHTEPKIFATGTCLDAK